jgi:hypothetical protein
MRARVLFLTIATALTLVGIAFAGSALKNPTTLILRKADMPRGAQYEATAGDDTGLQDALEAKGIDAEAASYLGASFSKAKGFWQISGAVFATASPGKAKQAYTVITKERTAWWRRLRSPLKKITPTMYGDQQTAGYDPPGGEGIALTELIVRRNTVVWVLWVKSERRPAIPNAEFFAEFRKYALKQKTRVGRG